MEQIRILQLGPSDLSKEYSLYEGTEWFYEPDITEKPDAWYDMAFLCRSINEAEREYLFANVSAYRLFYLDTVRLNGPTDWIVRSRKGEKITESDLPEMLLKTPRYYFSRPYGEKKYISNLNIAPNFHGSIKWNGFTGAVLEGDFGATFTQTAYWRYPSPLGETGMETWLEYHKEGNVEISLKVTQFAAGSPDGIKEIRNYSEKDLEELIYIENNFTRTGFLFISLSAKGSGRLEVVGLHTRLTRMGRGSFLPGGERFVTDDREEVFFYFDPGDMQPPLNVYFSGYKTQEGFEGYYMMRRMGCPFVLVSEPRLEGGAFYLGSEEYEHMIAEKLWEYMNELCFTPDQVNLSGLSMGTFGALYYGCDLHPHSIILGKPLASLGDIAENERIKRPGGFATSLDVMWKQYQNTDSSAIESMNARFWNKFSTAEWGRTKFIIAYMIEDDYDGTAYRTLLSHLVSDGVMVYGKGLHGRHNDDTNGIVSWFIDRYYNIMKEDFGRSFD